MKRLRIKRMQVMLSAILLIGMIAGYSIALLLSNQNLSVTVTVRDDPVLELAQKAGTPTFDSDGSITKGQEYNSSFRIDINNTNPDFEYDFYFCVDINSTVSFGEPNQHENTAKGVNMSVTPANLTLPWITGSATGFSYSNEQTIDFDHVSGTTLDSLRGCTTNPVPGIFHSSVTPLGKSIPSFTTGFGVRMVIHFEIGPLAPSGSYTFTFWTQDTQSPIWP
ncbi:MAG: hypothetical protein ACW981_19045 [Candidatus Hodarchaeales archaeon]|jgi:hypothetical protein